MHTTCGMAGGGDGRWWGLGWGPGPWRPRVGIEHKATQKWQKTLPSFPISGGQLMQGRLVMVNTQYIIEAPCWIIDAPFPLVLTK